MREQARAVIIGSGICGSSIAYHLAKLGWKEIILLEQGALLRGTTSHAPGLIGQLRSNPSLVALLIQSVELYRTLQVDDEPGFFEVGSLRLASSKPRMEELRRQHAFAPRVGLATELLTAAEAQVLFPLMDTRGVEGALFLPTDGSARAPILAEAMRRAAQSEGVQVFPHTRVTGIEVADGRVRSVATDRGAIQTEVVVAATGIWSPRIGNMAGVSIPLQPMQHQVLWTAPLPELSLEKPMANLRDPDHLVYLRQDGQGLALGGYELDPRSFAVDAIPDNDDPTKQGFDAARFEPLMRGGCARVPRLKEAPIARYLNGLESFTPDGEFILGEAPEVGGFWTACGFCAHGVSGSGGVGKALAEWIVAGAPGLDLSTMDIRRFGGRPMQPEELSRRVHQIYHDYYSALSYQG
jgi:4-methylaminobutanoate oxidase (formaldehyde-forming)